MPSGAVLLFDSLRIEHGTVGPKEGSTGMAPGQVARMGIALHCMKQVSGSNRVSMKHVSHSPMSLTLRHISVYTSKQIKKSLLVCAHAPCAVPCNLEAWL